MDFDLWEALISNNQNISVLSTLFLYQIQSTEIFPLLRKKYPIQNQDAGEDQSFKMMGNVVLNCWVQAIRQSWAACPSF